MFSHSARPPGPRAGAARTSDPHGHSPQCKRLESLQTTTILQGPPPRSRSEPPKGATRPLRPRRTQHRRGGSAGPSSGSTVRLEKRPPGAALRAASGERDQNNSPPSSEPGEQRTLQSPAQSLREPRAARARGGRGAEEHLRDGRCKGLPPAAGPTGRAQGVRGAAGAARTTSSPRDGGALTWAASRRRDGQASRAR